MRDLLMSAIRNGASDLHLTEDSPPVLRVDGRLIRLDMPPLSRQQLSAMIYALLTEDQIMEFEKDKELDFSLALPGIDRFRVNVHIQRGCVEAAFRRVPLFIPTIEQLQLPFIVSDLARRPSGLVLVTGPTGMGKTTTLAAMINLINLERPCVITCIEDPIEYLHTNNKAVIKQREVYRDTHSFAEALRRCLRQDPDVIVIGEMRDLETISTALTAAETGHLVLATVHTPDAPQTIERIIDVFSPHQQQQVRLQLASCLQGVISQRLLPKASGHGRIVAAEVMIATPGVRNMVREHSIEQLRTAIQTGSQFGMKTFEKSLKELIDSGLITTDVAFDNARSPEELKAILGHAR